ncbi:MAG: threonylcarbamoyl-AMP synthase [Chlamydiae bacterium GWC2_50_10]|nr:MAG: threonylcarbamoyl-AMP synthase [Chlamydiae bacterium GWA2_50_15]OGN54219.1 MAG: threonylcarbamoyl-AMP synthase [Chlamydiae bacterium GWC2_50_10]OGN55012.1 MAG: threonylcarbamoyl-AMP synthase [Chlamydiae bacterium GWF2_49_8]OGN58162.1 MAG: threonylcarbamoyl-AMP synthase [Chlamydiae bacterium RIFCSPHIGHO2_02_FULL_49_29]OGN62408.1 MAG: threonylcarbamoyl-AMP synthase [Chlamydiae bacterium RIFCSPHIGHO2_12_FULL_49_32]OGN67956.1 MAG: threonylcarbamoyl-AMP synthase [Chlamydiae bacterium RIFCSP
MKTKVLKEEGLREAAALLKKGEVVAFPTETVYGLGAPVFYKEAILKIFALKHRPPDNPLIAHISNLSELAQIVTHLPDEFFLLEKRFFPGPLTLILPVHPAVPKEATAGLKTIGVRMPGHPLALRLIECVGQPIVAPSANLSGRPSSTRAAHVLEDFSGRIPAVVDGGACTVGLESTVLSLEVPSHPVIFRPGAVTREELEAVLGRKVDVASSQVERPPSPGLKYRHYAPRAKLFLFALREEMQSYADASKRRSLVVGLDEKKRVSRENLFDCLRLADSGGYDEMLIYCDPQMREDEALMDRLTRAAGGSSLLNVSG